MRIYLDKLWLDCDLKLLNNYLHKQEESSYLYSDNSIIVIERNNFYILEINDGEVLSYPNYIDNINLTIDTTILKKKKEYVSHIPSSHIIVNKNIYHYKLREKSPLTFIVEKAEEKIIDFYFILEGYHAAYSNADLNNVTINEDFKDFFDIILKNNK
jgi:hypothetical protein